MKSKSVENLKKLLRMGTDSSSKKEAVSEKSDGKQKSILQTPEKKKKELQFVFGPQKNSSIHNSSTDSLDNGSIGSNQSQVRSLVVMTPDGSSKMNKTMNKSSLSVNTDPGQMTFSPQGGLSPAQQQQILEFRRNKGKTKMPGQQSLGGGFPAQQPLFQSKPQASASAQVSHKECEKKLNEVMKESMKKDQLIQQLSQQCQQFDTAYRAQLKTMGEQAQVIQMLTAELESLRGSTSSGASSCSGEDF